VSSHPATVVIVAYRTTSLDLSWLPAGVPVVLVHNDDGLDPAGVAHSPVTHLRSGRNIGFGAAVNRAATAVTTPRLVLVNPDVDLAPLHWEALAGAVPDEVLTVPLDDDRGRPTVVAGPYPTAATHLLGGLRAGRLAPRGSRRRAVADRLRRVVGGAPTENPTGAWPLARRWVSGAVMSLPLGPFRAVGGFDERYFLYYEDVDLCARLAASDASLRARVAATPPGRHRVGASARDSSAVGATTGAHRLESAVTYAAARRGAGWTATRGLLAARQKLVRP
jgi:N-acetylglucosaminyl-diphospho-decaprenol L-rhamnosyltransferase